MWICALAAGSGSSGPSTLFSESLHSRKAGEIAEKGTGDNAMIDVWTLVKACFFLVISKTFIVGTNLRKFWIVVLSDYKVLH